MNHPVAAPGSVGAVRHAVPKAEVIDISASRGPGIQGGRRAQGGRAGKEIDDQDADAKRRVVGD